jgi:membrane-associated phospholipid phosphatase
VTDQPPSLPPRLPQFIIRYSNTFIFGLSGILILGLFYYLSQLDMPTLQIVRTFTHPVIDQIGDAGNRLGDGLTLVLISLGIGAVGFRLAWPSWKSAGIHTLLAHGVAGLFAQILKHTIGRPRPRLMHGQNWEMAPSFESGFDSFPSGHTTASFAVATVLAHYFPKGRMVWFGLATFAGTCRVIKGSHFPTDTLGGVLLGVVTGLAIVHPPHKWKEISRQAFAHGLPWLVTAFGLVWILVPHPGLELEPFLSLFLGLTAIVAGLGLRLLWIRELSHEGTPLQKLSPPKWPRLLMGLGLATTAGSAVILGASLLAGIIWQMGNSLNHSHQAGVASDHWLCLTPIWTEAAIGFAMFLMALLTFSIRSSFLIS